MTLVVTHTFVSAIADGGDTTLVQPSNWNANHTLTGTLSVAQGGVGLTSYTIGDILYADSASTLAALADVATGKALISGGVGAAPSWGQIDLTTHVTGTLPIANGGTNATSLTSNAIDYFDGTSIASMAGTSWDNTNRSLTLTGATVTTSNPILNLSQTWNASGTTFTGLKFNITRTAAANNSSVFDFQIGGTSIFRARSDSGNTWVIVGASSGLAVDKISDAGLNTTWFSIGTLDGTSLNAVAGRGLGIGNGNAILSSAAANRLDLRKGTSAQSFRVYNTSDTGTTTDPTNYERGVFDWTTTANTLTIGAANGGTGTLRKLALVGAGILTDATILPTSDPGVAGQLYNNGGVVTVSEG